jgi:thioredoxin 1
VRALIANLKDALRRSGMNLVQAHNEPARADIDALAGPAVIEFGTSWCGYCRAAQAPIATAFAGHPGVRHIKVEDGSGRPLGRSFGVKLWPTLVFLRDGKEVSRLVRPRDSQSIAEALAEIDAVR